MNFLPVFLFALFGCAPSLVGDANESRDGVTLADLEARFGAADRSNPMQPGGVAHVWDPYGAGSSQMTCGLIVLTTSAGDVVRTTPFGNWPQCR